MFSHDSETSLLAPLSAGADGAQTKERRRVFTSLLAAVPRCKDALKQALGLILRGGFSRTLAAPTGAIDGYSNSSQYTTCSKEDTI